MGQGVKIILVNKTPYRWESSDISSYQLDEWEKSFPKHIEPGAGVSVYVEFHKGPFTTESDDQAWITYTMLGTKKPLRFKIHGTYSNEAQIDVELVGFHTTGNGFGSLLGKSRKRYFVYQEELRVNIGFAGDEATGLIFFDREQGNPNWMKFLDGRKLISEFTIPGTHDTLTFGLNEGLIKNLPHGVLTALSSSIGTAMGHFLATVGQFFLTPIFIAGGMLVPEVILRATQCQRLGLRDQLYRGVRFLDIRLKLDGAKLEGDHGGIRLHINFDEVLQVCMDFLAKNSSETIIMSIKDETGTNDAAFFNAVSSRIAAASAKWHTEDAIPKLADVRGKIVLFRRFEKHQQEAFGINAFNGWPDNGTASLNTHAPIRVQDSYKNYVLGHLDDKFNKHAKPLLEQAAGDAGNGTLYVNFMSGTGSVYPETVANGYMSRFIGTNGLLFDHVAQTTNRRFGIIPLDFPETPFQGILIAQLIMQNTLSLQSAFNRLIDPKKSYVVKPLSNLQKCIDVRGAKADQGTEVIVQDVNNGNNQQWSLEDAGQGYFYLHPLHAPSMVLDVKGSETAQGAAVIVFPKNGCDNQKWTFSDQGNGRFRISPKHAPTMALNLYGFDATNGKPIVIYPFYEGDLASQWEVMPI